MVSSGRKGNLYSILEKSPLNIMKINVCSFNVEKSYILAVLDR